MSKRPTPTSAEITFPEDDIIVSKTDPKGRITYANDVFCKVSGYAEQELLGQPHSLVRHPDMPRSVFQLLWQRIGGGEEIFAYVKNMARCGSCYWVFAHVTPSFGSDGTITGYHSNRRSPDRPAIQRIEQIYRELLAVEAAQPDRKAGQQAGVRRLEETLAKAGASYDELVFGITS